MKKLLVAILWLVLISSLLYAYFQDHYIAQAIELIIYAYIFLIVFPVFVGIEAVALYNIFDIFKDEDGTQALLASFVINLISLILGLILARNLPDIVIDPLFENYVAVPITVSIIVLFKVFIELVVLKIVFNPTLSVSRVLAFLLVSAVTLMMALHGLMLLVNFFTG